MFDSIIIGKFMSMPLTVRVITYLVFVLLFCYLTLLPRFVDGRVVLRDGVSGGTMPYRGAEMLLLVEGRSYKFKANEDGCWSIPVIPRFPTPMDIHVYHEDKSQWFKIHLTAKQVWSKGPYEIQVIDNAPFITIAERNGDASSILAALSSIFPREAFAGKLEFPNSVNKERVQRTINRESIKIKIVTIVSNITGMDQNVLTPEYQFNSGTITYRQKIQIISLLEREYQIRIPDEHWRSLRNVQEVEDYIVDRLTLARVMPNENWNEWVQTQGNIKSNAPVFLK